MSDRVRALLMLDLTRQTTRPDGSFGSLIKPAETLAKTSKAAAAALATARAAGDLVVWVVPGVDFVRRMSGQELTESDLRPDDLVGVPAADEPVIAKDGISGFDGGDLERTLRQHAVDKVVLAGIATQYVVKLSADDANKLGFAVAVLDDCCTDLTPEVHRATLEELRGTCADGPAAQLLAADDSVER
jgi:nicotinamidase-related amidase